MVAVGTLEVGVVAEQDPDPVDQDVIGARVQHLQQGHLLVGKWEEQAGFQGTILQTSVKLHYIIWYKHVFKTQTLNASVSPMSRLMVSVWDTSSPVAHLSLPLINLDTPTIDSE